MRRRAFLRTGIAGTLVGSAGCVSRVQRTVSNLTTGAEVDPGETTSVPMYKGDARNSGYFPDRTGPRGAPSVRWTFDPDTDRLSQAVLAGELLAVQGTETLHVLDAVTGGVQWTAPTAHYSTSAPAFSGGRLYALGREDGVSVYDPADGTERWTYDVDPPAGPLSVAQGTVVVVDEAGALTGLAATENRTVTEVSFTDIVDDARVDSGVAPAVSESGVICFPDARNSLLLAVRGSDQARAVAQFASVPSASPVVSGETAYVPTRSMGGDPDLHAFDLDAGELAWSRDLKQLSGVRLSPAIADGTLVLGSDTDGSILVLDVSIPGVPRPRWGATVDWGSLSSPVVTDDTVFVGAAPTDRDGGKLRAFDRNTGEQRWKMDVPGGVARAPAVTENALYVTTEDGRLHAIA
ncbi:MAG: PQQ-binding-like beta-propeller repeat protein [Halobacteriaceae archaeon]